MPRLPIIAAWMVVLGAAPLAGPAAAHAPRARYVQMFHIPPHDPAECYCLAQGRTFGVGETACLRTNEGPRIAECGMVLNNTSWRFTAKPCVES
jgi:hypothetical protein